MKILDDLGGLSHNVPVAGGLTRGPDSGTAAGSPGTGDEYLCAQCAIGIALDA